MSYRKSHVKTKLHRLKPKKSIFKRLWFWLAVLFVLIIIAVFYFSVFFPGVQVKNISVSGNQKFSSEDLKNFIDKNIDIKFFEIGSLKIASKSILLVNSDKLDKQILGQFPMIESVKIEKKFMQTLDFKVVERSAVAVFCPASSIGLPAGSDCYYIDDKGVTYKTFDGSESANTIVRQMTDNNDVSAGKKAARQNIIDLIVKAKKDLNDKFQLGLREVIIENETRLRAFTSENWQIYFDISPEADINAQIIKLNLLLGGGMPESSRKNLRYINLIPHDRAIVCDNNTCGG